MIILAGWSWLSSSSQSHNIYHLERMRASTCFFWVIYAALPWHHVDQLFLPHHRGADIWKWCKLLRCLYMSSEALTIDECHSEWQKGSITSSFSPRHHWSNTLSCNLLMIGSLGLLLWYSGAVCMCIWCIKKSLAGMERLPKKSYSAKSFFISQNMWVEYKYQS